MDDSYTDAELLGEKHSLLIKNAAASYGKKFQRIKPPSRNEASFDVSEFHNLNDASENKEIIHDLTASLDKTGKHAEVTRKVKKVKKFLKPLPPPLDNPEAEKIRRTVAFDATKGLLNRWEPIVGANRVADQLSFPLNVPYFRSTSTKSFLSNTRGKTPLESEIENLLGVSSKQNEEDGKQTFFLNRKEIMQQRRELAHIRAQKSFKEAKAWRQNKIKSKKYHRILRRERIKKQIKEFEDLLKTDPEAALKKIEELERTRVEERLTLRHRSTGQWAKSKAVRAKYDKKCREVLAQQLRLSKELTQKVSVAEDSDDGSEMEEIKIPPLLEDNPWIKQKSNDYEEFLSGYRKFWDQQLSNNTKQIEVNGLSFVKPSVSNVDSVLGRDEEMVKKNNRVNGLIITSSGFRVKSNENGNLKKSNENGIIKKSNENGIIKKSNENGIIKKSNENGILRKINANGILKKMNANGIIEKINANGIIEKINANGILKKIVEECAIDSTWECTLLDKEMLVGTKQGKNGDNNAELGKEIDLDDIFEKLEAKLKNGFLKKISSIKSSINHSFNSTKKNSSKPSKVTKGENSVMSLRAKKEQFGVDLEMNETVVDLDKELKTAGNISRIIDSSSKLKFLPESQKKLNGMDIDPNKFISIDENKPLKSAIPDMEEAGDADDDSKMKSLTIAEAFMDDDIANAFSEEKKTIVEEDKVKDVDLSLPGWGEWTGKGLPAISKRKKRRFMINAPISIPRKDDKKECVIINEKADANVKSHQVNELPFPYSGIDTFEASIRAPVGSTWIPETAHNKLTAPKVSTLMGAVIEPLTEDAIVDENEMKHSGDVEVFVPEVL